jgi:Fe-S-cluster containining protein
MNPEFKRTVCACETCVSCCKSQPGYMIPGDAEKIAAHLGEPVEQYLWASPGAKVMNTVTRAITPIGTITPRMQDGKCVFLAEDGKCRVHPVAPFGCAFFDTHMGPVEGNMRSMWGLRQIVDNPEYQKLRANLPSATSYKPRTYGTKL